MNRLPLQFDWLEVALGAVVQLEFGRVEVARVRSMARQIVAICRDQRDRAIAAERFLDENRDALSADQRNEALRLIAETLLYIQYGGIRVRVTDDPRRILRE